MAGALGDMDAPKLVDIGDHLDEPVVVKPGAWEKEARKLQSARREAVHSAVDEALERAREEAEEQAKAEAKEKKRQAKERAAAR